MKEPRIRTSTSHPLLIAEVAAGSGGGIVGITFCPGKQGPSLWGPHWRRDLAADIDAIARWGAGAVVTLIEDHEFEMLGVAGLGAAVRARGMAWHHLPVIDVRPPGEAFERRWQDVGPELRSALRCGRKIVVHCRGGLGRAGTVAARLLVELGMAPSDAISQVRAVRPGAIQTLAQQEYVMRTHPVSSSGSGDEG
jgi:ADP-ribosyl-[dinitrogen reductase] hydrolase